MDIHAERGLQCADCHFARTRTATASSTARSPTRSRSAAATATAPRAILPICAPPARPPPPRGTNLELIRNEDGRRRFEWIERDGRRVLIQRSIVDPNLEWEVSQVRDSADSSLPPCAARGDQATAGPCFNLRSARAKLMSRTGAETGRFLFGAGVPDGELAHPDSEMACFTCHLSWTTSCGGCHLPIEANWRTTTHHYEGEETRNFATYNPQVARDEMFQLGRHQTSKGNIIAPIRSTSALILSSTNINRERIYVQQPPISAVGLFEPGLRAAFPAHRPAHRDQDLHRLPPFRGQRQQCDHGAAAAARHQFRQFRRHARLDRHEGGFEAVRVTEWDEPQAVIGSYLHRYAYPDYFRMHVERNNRELIELDARRDVRSQPLGRDPRARAIRQRHSRHRRRGPLPAESRRIYVRRRRPRRLPGLRHRQHRQ